MKKASALICERNEVKYRFVKIHAQSYPVRLLCRVVKVSKSAFSAWKARPTPLITAQELQAKQRVAYKVTTKRQHSDAVAANLLNPNFNPAGQDQVWAGDITSLKTAEGWVSLAIVRGLYSRRIVGWATDKRMTTGLISRVMTIAYNLRQPFKGLVFHSDRGSHTPVRLIVSCWSIMVYAPQG